MERKYFAGIDLGAGFGAKIGMFDEEMRLIRQDCLPIEGISSSEKLTENLADKIREMHPDPRSNRSFLASVGLASPGLFASDGTYIVAANLGFLNGKNLRKGLEQELGVIVGIVNDADAGGLAAWHIKQEELLYWVFGGGWGGAWISKDGQVMHPAIDWDRKDSSLHPTNEPGYAVPIKKNDVKYFLESITMDSKSFSRNSYSVFRQNLINEFGKMPLGPSDDDASLRAETLVSGSGMQRLFRALTHHIIFKYEDILAGRDALGRKIDPGRRIDELAEQDNLYALKTHEFFGRFLGMAGAQILDAVARELREEKGGLSESEIKEIEKRIVNIPVYLAGKPSRAFPYFKNAALDTLKIWGHRNKVMPLGLVSNPNLVGAGVKAKQVYEQ